MGRLERSWLIVKASMRVLNERRKLSVFPVLSGIVTLNIAASFVVPALLASRDQIGDGGGPGPGTFLLFLLGYLVLAYVAIFFQVALVSQADVALDGGDPSVAGGLAAAGKKAGAIVPWALLSATVSLILRALEDRAGLLGRIVVGIAGLAWSLVTYLVVPVLVFENVRVGEALSISKSMFKRTWGENVAGNVGVGLISFLASLPALGTFVLSGVMGGAAGVALLVLAVIWLLIVGVVTTALSGIYQTALYRYAKSGTVVPAFGDTGIGHAFPVRERRSTGAKGRY